MNSHPNFVFAPNLEANIGANIVFAILVLTFSTTLMADEEYPEPTLEEQFPGLTKGLLGQYRALSFFELDQGVFPHYQQSWNIDALQTRLTFPLFGIGFGGLDIGYRKKHFEIGGSLGIGNHDAGRFTNTNYQRMGGYIQFQLDRRSFRPFIRFDAFSKVYENERVSEDGVGFDIGVGIEF